MLPISIQLSERAIAHNLKNMPALIEELIKSEVYDSSTEAFDCQFNLIASSEFPSLIQQTHNNTTDKHRQKHGL